jgi:hypothetical protein
MGVRRACRQLDAGGVSGGSTAGALAIVHFGSR